MKITVTLLMFLALLLPNALAEDYTQMNLPDGAVARLGKGSIQEIQYSPDGTRLAVASSIGIWFYDTATYREVTLLTDHANIVASLAFSPDGRTLAYGNEDDTVRLWDTTTGELKRELTGRLISVYTIVFSPDGKTLASGSWDKTVRLWDVKTGEQKHTLIGHTDHVYSVAFSPDGRTLASGGYDQTVRLWDVKTGEQQRVFHGGYAGGGYSVSFSPDGATLARGHSEGTVLLWDVQTGEQKREFAVRVAEVYAGWAGYITAPIKSVVFSPDGATLAGAIWDHVCLWDVKAEEPEELLTGHKSGVYGGRLPYSTDQDQHVLTGQKSGIYSIGSGIHSIAFSPEDRTLATGSADGTVRLWDAVTGEQQRVFHGGDAGGVYSVVFSPDGATLASGSRDGTVLLWDVKTGEQQRLFGGHKSYAYSLAFSPDGKLLASGSLDGTVLLWRITE